jgi:hypothetical protein
MKLLMENFKKFLTEADELIRSGENLIIFSDWAQGHIIRGHKEPGLGSVFKEINMNSIISAVESVPLSGQGGVYTVEVSEDIGYDLVLPMSEASALPNANHIAVEKEERNGPIEVSGVQTSAPLEQFATNKLSVVVRPSTMEYVPDSLKQDPEVQAAAAQGRLYGVLSSWPGRGDVPPASQWGEKWAVIIPK